MRPASADCARSIEESVAIRLRLYGPMTERPTVVTVPVASVAQRLTASRLSDQTRPPIQLPLRTPITSPMRCAETSCFSVGLASVDVYREPPLSVLPP